MKYFIAMLIASVMVLTACNTVAGAGRDVQKAGEVLEKAAEK